MQKGQTLIFVLLGIVMIAFVGMAFYAGKITPKPPVQNPAVTSQTPQPTPSSSPVSQECGICGPKGLHNLDGRQCASGLECKNQSEDVASSVYFCVKPGGSIKTCLEELQ